MGAQEREEGAVSAGVRREIVDAAARVIAERGESASMADVAAAAGIGRATLYRYFPNREALLVGLTSAALADLTDNIAAAELDSVDVLEGVARLSRAFFRSATRYAALAHMREKYLDKPAELERRVLAPVRELLQRGIDSGELREDVPLELHVEVLTGLYERVIRLVVDGRLGAEGASALVTSVFLRGVGAGRA
jgi:TetR/AcrR family transcriptional regulator, mexCD-oprJ operon repressor